MFNRILLPMDRSPLAECVLPHAVAVARAFESQVTLVHVMDPPHRANWRRAVDPLNWRIRKAEAESYLGDLVLRLQKASLPAEKQILEGQAADRIIEFSHKNNVPLIMLSSHGQSGLSGWNVSSVVQKIILRAQTRRRSFGELSAHLCRRTRAGGDERGSIFSGGRSCTINNGVVPYVMKLLTTLP